ncbi:hypothetical protein [Tenacibaculum sp. M341]|uniref:hypothetical protein n=1 Tax=Tenacibaculum sp. M341 TaxID=2530339 RepID=UPI00104D928B|nr:hypothetical protein [Tenacibaculum sp. M341]TCI91367.1 hypothetical protein EYW44_10445 [Tenacibaculum sp. M341]
MKSEKVFENIKVISFFIILSLLLVSCKETIELNSLIKTYANDSKELLEKKGRKDYLIRVMLDSLENEFTAHRIVLTLNLLEKSEIPDKILVYNESKIAFFTNVKMSNKEISIMKKNLRNKGFYRDENKNSYRSRYPETILLKNINTNKQVIVNDMSYEPIEKIVKAYKDKL